MCIEDVRLMRVPRARQVQVAVSSVLRELVPYNPRRVCLLLSRLSDIVAPDFLSLWYDQAGGGTPAFRILNSPVAYTFSNQIGLDSQSYYALSPDSPIILTLLYHSGLVVGPLYGNTFATATTWSYTECTLEDE